MNANGKRWAAALKDVTVRHPNAYSQPVISITSSGPHAHIHFSVDRIKDTLNPEKDMRSPFKIASVRLDIFPGEELARMWLAAAWFGYIGHETLEMVTFRGFENKVLDPHTEPYETNPFNRSLRDGMPPILNVESLRRTLLLVADQETVDRLTRELAE